MPIRRAQGELEYPLETSFWFCRLNSFMLFFSRCAGFRIWHELRRWELLKLFLGTSIVNPILRSQPGGSHEKEFSEDANRKAPRGFL